MAETIKGISVLIEGDTTGLSKALADVNKNSRDIQGELRQVERLLKLDPSNTELLAQKQQLLTNAVENTKEKLDRLKAAQEQINAQFAAGEINEGQYRAFQREVVATEQQLRAFEARLNDTGEAARTLGQRVGESAESINKAGETIKGAGEKMSMGVTAPIVAAGGAMLKGAIDAELAQGKLQASLGITADEAADLEAVAQAVWVNGFGENIGEVNDVISTVRLNMGHLAEDEMQKVSEAAMTIATLFGADVGDTTKTAGTLMKNFGMNSQDALDLITVGFQKGGDYSGELLDTLNEYSPQFQSMGMSVDQMMGVLIAGAQAGAFNLDKVGDSVKEFNLRAQDGSDSTAEGFAAIGLNANQMGAAIAKGGEDGQKAFAATVTALAAMKDPMQQNAAGTALFGSQWEDVRSKVIVAMADGMKGIGDFKGASDSAAAAMNANNPGLEITKALREVQLVVGPALLPLADIIKNTVAPAIKSLADWFGKLSPEGQKTVLVIAGIAAAIGPVLVILGTLITSVGTIAGAFSAASGAVSAAGGAMAIITGPIGIAIAIIAALAAAAYLIITNWGPIKEFFGNLWTGITTTISTAWEGIKAFFSQLPGAISVALTQAIAAVSQWGQNLIAWVSTAIPQVIESVTVFFSELPGKIGYALGYALGTIIKWGVDVVSWVATEVPKFITGIINFYLELPGKIAEVFTNVMTKIGEWGTSAINWVATEVPKFILKIVNFYAELPGKIGKTLSDVVTNLVTWITNMKTKVTTEIPKVISTITGFFEELPGEMLTIGGNLVEGLWKGINGMASWIKQKIKEFASGLIAGMKAALGIHSPSTVFAEIGKNVSLGMAVGITSGVSNVKDALDGLYTSAVMPDGSSIGVNGSGAGGAMTQNSYTFTPGSIVIPAKDLAEMKSVSDFFNRFPQVARQGV